MNLAFMLRVEGKIKVVKSLEIRQITLSWIALFGEGVHKFPNKFYHETRELKERKKEKMERKTLTVSYIKKYINIYSKNRFFNFYFNVMQYTHTHTHITLHILLKFE